MTALKKHLLYDQFERFPIQTTYSHVTEDYYLQIKLWQHRKYSTDERRKIRSTLTSSYMEKHLQNICLAMRLNGKIFSSSKIVKKWLVCGAYSALELMNYCLHVMRRPRTGPELWSVRNCIINLYNQHIISRESFNGFQTDCGFCHSDVKHAFASHMFYCIIENYEAPILQQFEGQLEGLFWKRYDFIIHEGCMKMPSCMSKFSFMDLAKMAVGLAMDEDESFSHD